jgi:hypothetical protein
MAGHSRSKNGIASLAYVPAIHASIAAAKAWMPAFAGMTECCLASAALRK